MSIIPQKTCIRCKQTKPATPEYFRKQSKNKDGLRSTCKTCMMIDDAAYRDAHPAHGKEWYEKNKGRVWSPDCLEIEPIRECNKCRVELPCTPEYFHGNTINRNGLSYTCKECKVIVDTEYLDENREHNKERSKARYHSNPEARQRYKEENAEQIAAGKRDWRKRNPEKVKKHKRESAKRNRPSHNRRIKRYNERHPEIARLRIRIASMKRRVKTDTTKRADLLQMYEDQNGRCAYCGISIYWTIKHDIHVDHIQPLVKGGGNELDNLCLTCADCNYSKSDHTLSEWIERRGW